MCVCVCRVEAGGIPGRRHCISKGMQNSSHILWREQKEIGGKRLDGVTLCLNGSSNLATEVLVSGTRSSGILGPQATSKNAEGTENGTQTYQTENGTEEFRFEGQ